MLKHIFSKFFLILVMLVLVSGPSQAQTWVGPSTGGNWNTTGNWSTSTVPNTTTAVSTISGALGGTSINVDTDVRLDVLNLDTNPTTLSSLTSSSLQINAINVGAGASGSSINNLFSLNSSSATLGLTTINFTSAGGVFNFGNINTPSSTAQQQTFRNISTVDNTVVNFNGNIELRSTATANSNPIFQASTVAASATSGTFVYNGVKSNGAGGTAGVTYVGGIHIHNVANTYTGTTILGLNSPNILGRHIIATDQAFGSGELRFSGTTGAVNSVRSADTTTRTLANRIQLQRNALFDGSGSFNLTGVLFQSNSSTLTNDVATGSSVTISGPNVYTRGAGDGTPRTLTFSGSGTTIINTAVHERPIDATSFLPETTLLQRGSVAGPYGGITYNGTGRLVLGNDFSANYGGNTVIASGTLQVGTNGVPVNIGAYSGTSPLGTFASPLSPSSIVGTGSGTVEFRHNGTQNVTNIISGALNIANTGTGATSFGASMFGTGSITSSGGGLVLINGGTIASITSSGVNPTGTSDLGTGSQVGTNLARLSGSEFIATNAVANSLFRGQVVSLTEGATSVTGTILDIYDPINTVHTAQALNYTDHKIVRLSTGVTIPAVTGTALDSLTTAAATGTGTRNVIADGGRVGGTGVIGGNLTVQSTTGSILAPGASIGTLTVNGNSSILGSMNLEYNESAIQKIDRLLTTGNLNLGAASVLNFTNIGTELSGPSYIFATYGGTLTGTFGTVNYGTLSGYTVDYAFGGNNIALVQAVPEPTSLALISLAIVSGAALRRRATKQKAA